MTENNAIANAVSQVPAGRWAIGVSGGADSVALFRAIRKDRQDVEPILVHLNHESRGADSDTDAAFVATLAERDMVHLVSERLSESTALPQPGLEAAYRIARHRLFARAVAQFKAKGVLLAHHADDRAETVLLRLLRGGEAMAIDGLRCDATVTTANGELRIHRPLLGVRQAMLKAFMLAIEQPWREDASNALHDFARNRVRSFLKARPALVGPLLSLADAADGLRAWTAANCPLLTETFSIDALGDLPDPLARAAARRWLIDRGSPAGDVSAEAAERLIEMCRDRATAGRRAFPGNVQVERKGTLIA